jgi:Mg/Co/Ni transporter MgtE
MTSHNVVTAVRAAASRKDIRELARAVRAAGPDSLVHAWPKLRPVERVAAFRSLSARAAAEVFAALPADGKWLAYLGEVSEGAAPLLEGARPSEAKLLRRATKRELNSMRKALAR